MGPYYDHAGLQARALEAASRYRSNGARISRRPRAAMRVRGHASERAGSWAAGILLVPGVALACNLSGLLKLAAGDVWTMLLWRALFSASLIALAAAVSSLDLSVAG
jgi:hypothetical protein